MPDFALFDVGYVHKLQRKAEELENLQRSMLATDRLFARDNHADAIFITRDGLECPARDVPCLTYAGRPIPLLKRALKSDDAVIAVEDAAFSRIEAARTYRLEERRFGESGRRRIWVYREVDG